MRIKQIIIRKLKVLQQQDDSFDLGAGLGISPAVCLRGVNGSGKTTYLDTIASMWEHFRIWLKSEEKTEILPSGILANASQVAIELDGFPGQESSLWLLTGRQTVTKGRVKNFFLVCPGLTMQADFAGSEVYSPTGSIDPSVVSDWERRLSTLPLASLSESPPDPLPNVTYLGAEHRYLSPLATNTNLSEPEMEDTFRWLARYKPSRLQRNHIENSITVLRLVSPARFREIREKIHEVLSGVELLDAAEPRTMRPLVRVAGGVVTTLDGLSAGERAAFISLFHIARWMTKGGIVLIDEPELHQHLSLMRVNLVALERYVVKTMGGQLIVASHAPDVWDYFRHTKLLIDLTPSAS